MFQSTERTLYVLTEAHLFTTGSSVLAISESLEELQRFPADRNGDFVKWGQLQTGWYSSNYFANGAEPGADDVKYAIQAVTFYDQERRAFYTEQWAVEQHAELMRQTNDQHSNWLQHLTTLHDHYQESWERAMAETKYASMAYWAARRDEVVALIAAYEAMIETDDD
jgi:hypothetical protein